MSVYESLRAALEDMKVAVINYGADAEDFFSSQYLGYAYYPGFIRGYNFNSFDFDECQITEIGGRSACLFPRPLRRPREPSNPNRARTRRRAGSAPSLCKVRRCTFTGSIGSTTCTMRAPAILSQVPLGT